MPESIESFKFVSHRARMSGEFDSRKDSQSTKFERRPRIFVKLSFRELVRFFFTKSSTHFQVCMFFLAHASENLEANGHGPFNINDNIKLGKMTIIKESAYINKNEIKQLDNNKSFY